MEIPINKHTIRTIPNFFTEGTAIPSDSVTEHYKHKTPELMISINWKTRGLDIINMCRDEQSSAAMLAVIPTSMLAMCSSQSIDQVKSAGNADPSYMAVPGREAEREELEREEMGLALSAWNKIEIPVMIKLCHNDDSCVKRLQGRSDTVPKAVGDGRTKNKSLLPIAYCDCLRKPSSNWSQVLTSQINDLVEIDHG